MRAMPGEGDEVKQKLKPSLAEVTSEKHIRRRGFVSMDAVVKEAIDLSS
jgi:hypothetical protein